MTTMVMPITMAQEPIMQTIWVTLLITIVKLTMTMHWLNITMPFSERYVVILRKISKFHDRRKNSSKFVYVQAKKRRSTFNLTIFLASLSENLKKSANLVIRILCHKIRQIEVTSVLLKLECQQTLTSFSPFSDIFNFFAKLLPKTCWDTS